MKQNFFSIEQKKGNPNQLMGKVIAYAKVLNIPPEGQNQGSMPFHQLITNGILAVIGDYTRDSDMKSFLEDLKASSSDSVDFSVEIEEIDTQGQINSEESADLTEFLEEITEQSQSLSQEDILEKLSQLSHIEVIPVPAQIGHFESEEEILAEDADIYFMGEFSSAHNAQLSTTTFPMMYQATFKEQNTQIIHSQIDTLLDSALVDSALDDTHSSEIQASDLSSQESNSHEVHQLPEGQSAQEILSSVKTTLQGTNYKDYNGSLSEFLFQKFVPVVLHHFDHPETDFELFRRFMTDYPFPEDINRLEEILPQALTAGPLVSREIGLLCEKFSALREEKFEDLKGIQKELLQIQS